MKYLIFLLSIFVLVGCDKLTLNPPAENPSASKLVGQINRKVCSKLLQEKKLRAIGSGSQMMDEIKMLALSFNYYEPVNEEKARELLLVATQELINAVNEEPRIRPFLGNYPFEPKNVEIRIFFYNHDGSKVASETLCNVSALEGDLDYLVDGPKYPLFKCILKESYEEALQKQARSTNSNTNHSIAM